MKPEEMPVRHKWLIVAMGVITQEEIMTCDPAKRTFLFNSELFWKSDDEKTTMFYNCLIFSAN